MFINGLKILIGQWKILLRDSAFRLSLLLGILILAMAYFLNLLVNQYNDLQVYLSVGDLVLDAIPTYNLDFVYTWGMYFLVFLIFAYPVFFKPELVPFAMKSYAILGFLRCGSILLTNLGPPEGAFYSGELIGGHVVANFLFRNDLFFSGHTAYPFLAYLIYRTENKLVAMILLLGAIVEGATVLLMHVHYSIDVFGAFFIAYGTYRMTDKIFNRLNLRFKSQVKIYGLRALEKIRKFKN